MHFIVFVLILNSLSYGEGLWGFNWLWKSHDASQNRALQYVGDVPVPNVPYEAKTDDEKFLEAAKQYTNLQLSELDSCQHKIVLQIQKSCSEMTEEDLAKMSVNLLNCQSAVEGRQQFDCTPDMALRDCTSSMDPDTWNAYHLISNRARAVCYAARQQQFRAQSDIAVNKLMQTAFTQINNMEKLKESHQKLTSFTTETLKNVADGQETLLQQQERMKVSQQTLKNFVGLNLRELTKEKALIAAGHKELSKLTEDIKNKLDNASAQLLTHSSEQQNNHKKVVEDLELVKEQAKLIWKEIEKSTYVILAQHEDAAMKYEETLEKLTKINNTVNFLLSLMETMHLQLDERLGWLNGIVGAAGIYAFSMHILYLLVGMIATAYVNAPSFTRLTLIAIVPLNLAVLYHHGSESALDFISMSIIIFITTAVQRLIVSVMDYANTRGRLQESSKSINGELPGEHQSDLSSLIKSLWFHYKGEISKWIAMIRVWSKNVSSRKPSTLTKDDDVDSLDGSESSGSIAAYMGSKVELPSDNHFRPIRRENITQLQRHLSSLERFSSPPTPPRSSSSSSKRQNSRPSTPRPFCVALCRNGLLCRNTALSGKDMCRVHQLDPSN